MTYGGECLLAGNAVDFFIGLQGALRQQGVMLGMPAMIRPTPIPDPADVDLLFACGLLTREWIADGRAFEVVAAPILPGETAAVYRSVVIARDDGPTDLVAAQEATLAVNEYRSWSGWHGYVDDLRTHSLPVPTKRVTTGGHRESVQAVRERPHVVAAIDSSLWRWLPATERAGLRVIHETADWPAPPLSVRQGTDPELVAALLSVPSVVAASTADYDFMLGARNPIR